MTTTNQTLFNPTQLVIELDQTTIDRAWKQSQPAGNSTSRWQKYLNQVTLNTFLPWLREEEDSTAKAGLEGANQSDLWSVVNGTSIELDGAKLVLIPTEVEDLSELRVPQEWIDIPELIADYYLAVQVSIDSGYIRVWGYTTHQQLKNKGNFSHGDRTYSLSDEELITDIDVLWVARELCPDEITQAAIAPIDNLADVQAENLIQRLGSQSQVMPRLAVPFTTWAGLIKNPDCRRRLGAARRQEGSKTPVLQWLKEGANRAISEFGWRQIEMSPSTSGARSATVTEPASNTVSEFGLAKKIMIANQPYELRVLPLEEAGSWRFELGCLTPGCVILPGVKLRLLTEDLEAFEGNEDLASEPVEQLFIELYLEAGESLVWQVEPTPDNYQQEVLQF